MCTGRKSSNIVLFTTLYLSHSPHGDGGQADSDHWPGAGSNEDRDEESHLQFSAVSRAQGSRWQANRVTMGTETAVLRQWNGREPGFLLLSTPNFVNG